MNKVMDISEVSRYIKSGMTVMIGGFANYGVPNHLVHALCDAGIKLFSRFLIRNLRLNLYLRVLL